MNWQAQLVTTYLYVCKHYHEKLWVYCQRMSKYSDLSFTDKSQSIYLELLIAKQVFTRFTSKLTVIYRVGFLNYPVMKRMFKD
jgi:hypothetical protein